MRKDDFSRKELEFDLNNLVDFTLLDPRATEADLEKLCDVAYKNRYYSVCVNPCNVSFVKGYISKNLNDALKVVCVIGFPLGANSLSIKVQEAKEAISSGADELDVVINIGKAKQGKFDFVKNELKRIRAISKKVVLKAIIETCYFDENQIVKLSKICLQSKVDFIKTSTGFGIGGAKISDVKLIYNTVKGGCKVKASGGICSREMVVELVNAGANRIGTSHII